MLQMQFTRLSILFSIACANAVSGNVEHTVIGPSNEQESRILWEKGRKAFGEGKYVEATHAFERIISRYPGSQGYLDSHLYLGILYVKLGEPAKATPPLKRFIDATNGRAESFRARITLARALLNLKKPNEALLTSLEVLGGGFKKPNKENPSVPWDTYLEALLVKSRSLLDLNRDSRSLRALSSYYSDPKSETVGSYLRPEANSIRMEIKLRECGRITVPGPVEEDVFRSQIAKRRTCILESLVGFHKDLSDPHPEWTRLSRNALISEIEAMKAVHLKPPRPLGRRTKSELKSYRTELVDRMKKDLDDFTIQAKDLIHSWTKKEDTQSWVRDELSKVSETL